LGNLHPGTKRKAGVERDNRLAVPSWPFCYSLTYNLIRGVYSSRRKALELEEDARGLPVIFSLTGTWWGRFFTAGKCLFLGEPPAHRLPPTGHFLQMRVPGLETRGGSVARTSRHLATIEATLTQLSSPWRKPIFRPPCRIGFAVPWLERVRVEIGVEPVQEGAHRVREARKRAEKGLQSPWSPAGSRRRSKSASPSPG